MLLTVVPPEIVPTLNDRFRAACGNFVLIELRDDGRKALNGVYVSEIDKRVTARGLHCDLVAQRADRHADDAVKVTVKRNDLLYALAVPCV